MMRTIKALTIRQPWASAIAQGLKVYETRSWLTNYRGPIALHAGVRFTREDKLFALEESQVHGPHALDPGKMPLGAVIAIGVLVECRRTEDVRDSLLDLELTYGDFSDGRFAWEVRKVRRIKPVPAKGALGLWNWVTPR